MRKQFRELQEQDARAKLAELLDPAKAVTASSGQGTIFIVGADFAAVHSEPPIKEQRLFISIVPGSQTDIEELDKRWNTPNPDKLDQPGSL